MDNRAVATKVKFDDKEYDVNDLSENARAHLDH